MGNIVNNIKTFFANNSTFGRMNAFGEDYKTAFKNIHKNQLAEFSTLLGNYTPIGRIITKDESILKSLGFRYTLDREISPVDSPVPRRCYEG